MSIKLVVIICVSFVFFSCGEEPKKDNMKPFEGLSKQERNSKLENGIKNSIKKEHAQIESYLKRHEIKAHKTGTGVYFFKIEEGVGDSIQSGQTVKVLYTIESIRGDLFYSTDSTGVDEFKVEKSQKESGLHEAIKLMKNKSKALIIIPSYRAHGITGDDGNIPPNATVIYKLEVKGVE